MSGGPRAASIPSEAVADARQLVAFSAREVLYAGPVPHPDILRQYNELVPGSAERILAQAERQTDHRIAIERLAIESDVRRSQLGLIFGFVLALCCIVGGCTVAALGHDAAGGTIATAAVVALAGVFVYGTSLRKKERQRKAEEVAAPDPGSR